jgi:hypothetical protein
MNSKRGEIYLIHVIRVIQKKLNAYRLRVFLRLVSVSYFILWSDTDDTENSAIEA